MFLSSSLCLNKVKNIFCALRHLQNRILTWRAVLHTARKFRSNVLPETLSVSAGVSLCFNGRCCPGFSSLLHRRCPLFGRQSARLTTEAEAALFSFPLCFYSHCCWLLILPFSIVWTVYGRRLETQFSNIWLGHTCHFNWVCNFYQRRSLFTFACPTTNQLDTGGKQHCHFEFLFLLYL